MVKKETIKHLCTMIPEHIKRFENGAPLEELEYALEQTQNLSLILCNNIRQIKEKQNGKRKAR